MMPMTSGGRVPMVELAALVDALDVALFLAEEQYFGAGYTELVEAREEAAERGAGQPWEGEIEARFRHVLDRYCDQWGVPVAIPA
jgi:hypothetical protein